MNSENIDPVANFLESREINFQTSEGGFYDHKYVDFSYAGENTKIDVNLHYIEGGNVFTVFAMIGNKVPKNLVDETVKLANIANNSAKFGSMVVEPNSGSVWFRISNSDVDTPGDDVYHSQITNACESLDFYFPALMQIIYSGASSEDAVKDLFEKRPKENESKWDSNISRSYV